ncbi:MAG: hypothetical protein IJX88_05810 [Clostridia bacterium]|nr:hypothetical protein [Clostridia bacterium]
MRLTLDIGGSKTRGVLLHGNKEETFSVVGGFGRAAEDDEVIDGLYTGLRNVVHAWERIERVAVNLGGKNKEQIWRTVSAAFPSATVLVFRESEGDVALKMLSLFSCDVLVMAGTGCIAFAKSDKGTRVLDGWGKDFGDDGSGYAIGNRALRYACKELDGGGRLSLLTKRLTGFTQAFDFACIRDYTLARDTVRQRFPAEREAVAAIAKTVVACAEEGCALSQKILNECGESIAEIALRAEKNAGLNNASILLNGGLTRCYAFWEKAFKEKVGARRVLCMDDGIDRALKNIVSEE